MTKNDPDSPYALATLAARICRITCRKDPKKAVAIAQALLAEAVSALDPDREKRELQQMAEEYDQENADKHGVLGSRSFEPGVKIITAEKRLDRAMPYFRKFLKALHKSDKKTEENIVSFREKGFTPGEMRIFSEAFPLWKQKAKSEQAKRARSRRKET